MYHAASYMYHCMCMFYRIQKMMSEAVIAYSLVIMFEDRIYAVRDPFGNRPLCIGKLLAAASLGSKQNV